MDDSLGQQLESLERDLRQLLSASGALQIKLFEAKLAELIAAIGCIPADDPDVASIWAVKMANLLRQLRERSGSSIPSAAVNSAASFRVLPSGDCGIPSATTTELYNEINSPPEKVRKVECFPTPEPMELSSASINFPSDGGLQCQSSSVIRPQAVLTPAPSPALCSENTRETKVHDQVRAAFACQVPVRGPTDMPGFRKLLVTIAKVKKCIEQLGKRCPFYADLLPLALAKMPNTTVQQFTEQVEKPNLSALASYLFNLIKTDAEQNASYPSDEFSRLFTCQYCKSHGHNVNVCHSRKATLCFNCFTWGHSLKRCPSPPILPEDVHF